jgi:hypothetical protein
MKSQENGQIMACAVKRILCFIAIIAVLAAASEIPAWPWRVSGRFLAAIMIMLFWAFVIGGSILFVAIFRGEATGRRIDAMVSYCYGIAAFLAFFTLAFIFFPTTDQKWPEYLGPIGIVLGCSEYPQSNPTKERPAWDTQNWVPKEIACGHNTTQWLVNFGGKAIGKTEQECAKEKLPCEGSIVRGGMVVPLYFIIVSLFGAVISLTRRVPEFQARIGANTARPLAPEEAREFLVFQIMQLASAPLLASAAYYVIDPGTRGGSIAVAFTAGFSSETILLAIRTLMNKLQPLGDTMAPILVSPGSLDFGPCRVGETRKKDVTLTNRSSTDVTVRSVSVTDDFKLGGSATQAFAIAPGAAKALSIEFTPTSEGARSGKVAITDDGVGSPRVVVLRGTGGAAKTQDDTAAGRNGTPHAANKPAAEDAPAQGVQAAPDAAMSGAAEAGAAALSTLAIEPGALDFGTCDVGQKSTLALHVTRASDAPLEVQVHAEPGDFSAAPSGTVKLGKDERVEVTFTPSAAAPRNGTLTISGGAGAPKQIGLTGTGR